MNPLVEFVRSEYDRCVGVVEKKNADYAGQRGGADPLANFRLAETLGVCSTDRAVLIRLIDKIARLATLIEREPAVVEESFADTVRDAINYLAILLYARQQN